MSLIQYYGTGKRKTSIARVYLRPGKGDITLYVNKKLQPFQDFFSLESHRHTIKQPLHLTETESKFDMFIRVNGGGHSGQAEAIRLGVARALVDGVQDSGLHADGDLAVRRRRDLARDG